MARTVGQHVTASPHPIGRARRLATARGPMRELENAVERAVVVCRREQIGPSDLAPTIAAARRGSDGMPPIPGSTLAELERYAILKTLEHTGGSTSRASSIRRRPRAS